MAAAWMTSTRVFHALDFAFRFESDDADLVGLVERCYRDMAADEGPPHVLRAVWRPESQRFHVTIDDPAGGHEVCEEGVTTDGVLGVLTWEINRGAEATRTSGLVLHAAVTAGSLGAIAMCGPSHSGKSTLAAASAVRGWRHLSDDLASIDVESMTVRPFARPIMLRPGGRDVLGVRFPVPASHRRFLADECFVPASDLGARTCTSPEPLVGVVMLSLSDRARREPVLERLRPAHLLFELTSNTVHDVGRQCFEDLARIARAVPGYRLSLGDVQRSLDHLAALVGAGELSGSRAARPYTAAS